MARRQKIRLDLLGLAVLALIVEAPRHAYEIARLLQERNQPVPESPRLLYHAVARLERHGLIRPLEITRKGRRPERTVYTTSETGFYELTDWIKDLLRNFYDSRAFFAALSHISALTPEETIEALRFRIVQLEAIIAAKHATLNALQKSHSLPRLFLIEEEYACDQLQAEVMWVRNLIDEINTQQLLWPDFVLQAIHQPSKSNTLPHELKKEKTNK